MKDKNEIATQVEYNLPSVPQTMSEQLLAMAIDKDLDMDKLERLIEMRDREEEKTSKAAFNSAMARVQQKIEPVVADAENLQTDSRYSKLSTIVTALKPIYTGEGFSVSFSTGECASQRLVDAGWFRTIAEVSHTAGYTKTYHVDLPADTTGAKGTVNKTVIHGTKSAISYARVILMGLIFNFVTSTDVDDDGNAAGTETISEKDAIILRDELNALDADIPFFCNWLKIPSLEQMPLSLLGKARKSILEQKKAAGQ